MAAVSQAVQPSAIEAASGSRRLVAHMQRLRKWRVVILEDRELVAKIGGVVLTYVGRHTEHITVHNVIRARKIALKKKEAGIPVSGLSNRSPDGTRWYPKEGIGGPGPFSVFPFCPSEPSTAFPRLKILWVHRLRRTVRLLQQTLSMKPKRRSRRDVCA